ncbi:type I-F CRISPR-associated endoribonuclease Cas6/Csy4 [Burkholderia sp. Leaf177]|uniref:type I-F CRISPR-associated endoribonuclease Cas6/Csy4 n=1 Tax=Burkholderia sp. Leaf177 TaxID=1736287 RepID=UPI0006F9790C|nr:type I-F CRISPR-associated endoribonuclease Cas6/Csy4 [Burkholderia sp. Leaf177]KQR74813.1 type I-F CRISPR-associated endoribonuclease Cas6/Csy4 [Burkholderia sp. Leaf177]
MTTHFINITLLPDPEFSQVHLLGALVAKLHKALVRLRREDIGVSFPEYSLRPRSLGKVVRLHGGEATLLGLMAHSWLQGMRDHVAVSAVALIPDGATYQIVQRRQFKTNVERMRRRRMRRKDESIEQAAAAIPDSVERTPNLPYVQMRSASTGESFCLFIDQAVALAGVSGKFNGYGLSQGATVPCF